MSSLTRSKMSFLVFLLLVASGVTECRYGCTLPGAALRKDPARRAQASPDYLETEPWLVREEDADPVDFVDEDSPAGPVKKVCMMKVNCIDNSAVTSEELQRDEEFQTVPTTPKEAETTTPSSGTTKAKRPPLPCTVEIQVVRTYRGHCIRLDQDYGGCRAGPWLTPMVAPCHPPPQD